MTEAAAAINGRRLAGRYRLLEMLGAGGQGEVWRARDDTRGIDVALKVLSPELGRNEGAWAALQHEHAIASRLDHSSILKVYPPERADDAVVLPMELAAGGDLRRLRGAGYLEIIPVLLEVAQALKHAQEEPVPELVPAKEIPRLLRLLVMRMLAKSPRARPRSMRAVIDELDAALNDTLAFDFEGVVDPARKPPLAVAAAPSASPVE